MTNQTESAVNRVLNDLDGDYHTSPTDIAAARAELDALRADRKAMSDHLRRAIEWAPVEGPDGEWWMPWVAHAKELTHTDARGAREGTE